MLVRRTSIVAIVALSGVAILGGVAAYAYFDPLTSPAIKACEDALKRDLVAPDTYKRIDAFVSDNTVFVEYSASNRMGVPLRDDFSCDFEFYDGHFALSKSSLSANDNYEQSVLRLRYASINSAYWPLTPERTGLKPAAKDAAIDSCVGEVAAHNGVRKPRRHEFTAGVGPSFDPSDHQIYVRRVDANSNHSIPYTSTCDVKGGKITVR